MVVSIQKLLGNEHIAEEVANVRRAIRRFVPASWLTKKKNQPVSDLGGT